MEMALIYKWINFGIFNFALFYFLREPVRDFLGDRRESFRKTLEELRQKRHEMELRLSGYRKRLETAETEIRKITGELRKEGELEKQNLIKKAQGFAQKIRDDAEKMGKQGLIKAKFILRKKTLDLALTLARKRLNERIGPEDHERLALWAIKKLNSEQSSQEIEGKKDARSDLS